MEPSARFWDKIAERYARRPVVDEASYRKKLEVTRGYFTPDMEVLEFGCGAGSTALVHAPHVRHIRAIDISSKMIDICRRKAAEAKICNVSFEVGTIEDLEFSESPPDVVMGHSILHLLEDKEAAIAKVFAMLKPGGVFVSSTTCIGDTMKWIKLIEPLGRRLGLMPRVRVFTVDELVSSITDAGFEIDHRWQPGKNKAVFIVAKKPER